MQLCNASSPLLQVGSPLAFDSFTNRLSIRLRLNISSPDWRSSRMSCTCQIHNQNHTRSMRNFIVMYEYCTVYITDSCANHFLIAETRFELQYIRVPVCSRELSSSSALHGVVASPNYPDLYPNYADCFTHIVPPQPPSIDFVLRGLVLQFHSFAPEDSALSAGRLTLLHSCTYDSRTYAYKNH